MHVIWYIGSVLLPSFSYSAINDKQNTVFDILLRKEYINYISYIFSLLTKSCFRIYSCFVVAIDVIPLIVAVDDDTVLASRSPIIVWFARTPVGEDDTFES